MDSWKDSGALCASNDVMALDANTAITSIKGMPEMTKWTAEQYQAWLDKDNPKKRKPGKKHINSAKVTIDDIVFDSGQEGRRYCNLKLRVRLGEITDLKIHTKYPLVVNGIKIGDYTDDFSYTIKPTDENSTEEKIIEDVKPYKNYKTGRRPMIKAVARLRHKLFTALYDTKITYVEF